MPTDYEGDDYSTDKSIELFNCDDYLRDNIDYICDESFLDQISNELDVPLFESDTSILFEDVSLGDISHETTETGNFNTTQTNFDEFWNSVPENSTYSNYEISQQRHTNGSTNSSVAMKMETSSDTNSVQSHSPTPSHSSSDGYMTNDTSVFNFLMPETPPISPPRNNNNNLLPNGSPPQNQSVVINGNIYQMISLNNSNTVQNNQIKSQSSIVDSKNIINLPNILPSTAVPLKVPIKNTTVHKSKSGTKKVLYPKCTSKPVITNGLQLITIPVESSEINKIGNKSEADLKAYKKQQRMIKNRESACMSRKRKRDYLMSLEKKCQQLVNENEILKKENNTLKQMLAKVQNNCKTSVLNITKVPVKNATFLLAVLVMVSVNIGSFSNLFGTWNNNDFSSDISIPDTDFHTRHLMSIPADFSTANESTQSWNDVNTTHNSSTTQCPLYVNQTESVRLASELRRYIGDSFYNWTLASKKRKPKYINRYWEQDSKRAKRKGVRPETKVRLNKWYSLSSRYRQRRQVGANLGLRNEVEVYSLGSNFGEYSAFFNSIDMQDDTFYVVSLRADHMLIPALNHNKTSRPKMSLLMPSITTNPDIRNNGTGDHITLMKIDCEVTNTNLVQVNEKLIPQHLRPSFQNSSHYESPAQMNLSAKSSVDENERLENVTITREQKQKQFYKPYFIKSKNGQDDNLLNLKMRHIKFP